MNECEGDKYNTHVSNGATTVPLMMTAFGKLGILPALWSRVLVFSYSGF